MADKNPTADSDWEDEWDNDDWDAADDASSEPAQPVTAPGPAQPPSYDVPDDMDDDEGLLPPPPTDSFVAERAASRTTSKRGTRPARVRAAGSQTTSASENSDEPEQTFSDAEPSSSDPAADTPKKKGSGCGLMLLVLVIFGVVIAAAAAFAFRGAVTEFLGEEGEPEPSKPALSTAMSAPSSSAAPATTSAASTGDSVEKEVEAKCVSSDDKTEVGNGKGDQKSGPGVIFAFDYAYYVERSGTAARKLMSPELKGTTVESLQDAIDKLPEDTQHCLWITPKDGEKDVYSVKLAEYVPDGDGVKEVVHEQVIHTAKDGDKYIIIGIVNP